MSLTVAFAIFSSLIAAAATSDDRADGPYSEYTPCKLCTENCHRIGFLDGGFVEVLENYTNTCQCQGEASEDGKKKYLDDEKEKQDKKQNKETQLITDDPGNGVLSPDDYPVTILVDEHTGNDDKETDSIHVIYEQIKDGLGKKENFNRNATNAAIQSGVNVENEQITNRKLPSDFPVGGPVIVNHPHWETSQQQPFHSVENSPQEEQEGDMKKGPNWKLPDNFRNNQYPKLNPTSANQQSSLKPLKPLKPETTGTNPTVFRTHPAESGTHLAESGTYLTKSSVHPTEPGTHLIVFGTHPTKSRMHPTKTGIHSTKSSVYQIKSRIHPIESDTHPTKTSPHQPDGLLINLPRLSSFRVGSPKKDKFRSNDYWNPPLFNIRHDRVTPKTRKRGYWRFRQPDPYDHVYDDFGNAGYPAWRPAQYPPFPVSFSAGFFPYGKDRWIDSQEIFTFGGMR